MAAVHASMRGHDPIDDDARVDVVVVGGGVVGLTTAWQLHRRGLAVTVVDPDPGGGASRAAAGMLAPASEVQYQQNRLFPLMLAAAGEYPDVISALERATGQSAGYRTTETLVCAADAADRQTLADLQRLQLQHGRTVEQLTVRAARALEPALSPRLTGAFRAPGDHQVDPRRLVAALLSALAAPARRGARVVRERAVTLLRGGSGDVAGVVLADGTRIRAEETVLATGTGTDSVAGLPLTVRLPVRPVHGDILRTRLPPGTPPLLERTIRGLVNGVPVYLVPRTDGEIVIGATTREDRLDGPNAGGVFRLLRDAQALVPGVADLELTEVMARARPGTPDDLPYLGRVRDADGRPLAGLVVSAGYFRHGVLMAPLAARLVAQLVTGDPGPDPAADATYLRAADPHRLTTSEDVSDQHTLQEAP